MQLVHGEDRIHAVEVVDIGKGIVFLQRDAHLEAILLKARAKAVCQGGFSHEDNGVRLGIGLVVWPEDAVVQRVFNEAQRRRFLKPCGTQPVRQFFWGHWFASGVESRRDGERASCFRNPDAGGIHAKLDYRFLAAQHCAAGC